MHGGRVVAAAVVVLIAVIVAGPTVADVTYANALRVSVQVTPARLPGDARTAATITLRYRDGAGKPRAGDILNLLDVSRNTGTIVRSSTGGNNPYSVIQIYRIVTDGQGKAVFRYIAPASNPYVPTLPAHLQVTDTSLGTVLEIDKMTMVTIDVVDPSRMRKGAHGTHS